MGSIIAKYQSTVDSNFKLSPSLHRQSIAANSNTKLVSEFLTRKLERRDLGVEVGSINYVNNSNFYFIRTKALQSNSYLPEISNESVMNIHPKSFLKYDLKENDLLISKDSNIGEVIILDKDYPNYMPSGALFRLPITENKYYLLAFLKNQFFRNQLDMLVPKGATIRHAGTKFLDCKIPLPNKNTQKVIDYVEGFMKLIVNLEKAIKTKFSIIEKIIIEELNQSKEKAPGFVFNQPTVSELLTNKRLDTGIYSNRFKEIDYLIKNYKHGFEYIDPKKLKSGKTPDIRHIGNDHTLKYRWVTPSNCSDIGYLNNDERISMPEANNLNQNSMLLVNRTSRGGRGEYVGIAVYYDLDIYGIGQYNQGIYRIFNYSNEDLIFKTCFMNTSIMRKYCSYMCVGSKMKEMKASQFLTIPFPAFGKEIKDEMLRLYTTPALFASSTIVLKNEASYLEQAGLMQLEETLREAKIKLDSIIANIIDDVDVEIV